jgi:hypothetical protein
MDSIVDFIETSSTITREVEITSALRDWVIVHFNYFWNFRVFSG